MRRTSSAHLRLERFLLVSCSASLTPWFYLFHFPGSGFMMYHKTELNRSVLSGVSLLGSSLEVEVLAFHVSVHSCSLLVAEHRELLFGSSTPCSLKAVHTLLCSTVSNASLKSMAATHCGSLSKLLEHEKVVCRGVSWSEAWSATWLASSAGCSRWMRSWPKSLYKMGIAQVGRQFDGDAGPQLSKITLISPVWWCLLVGS